MDRWIIEIHDDKIECLFEWRKTNGLNDTSCFIKKLPIAYWYVLNVPPQYEDELKQLPCVQSIFRDQQLKNRNTFPDDPRFTEQANMNLIGMPSAWDITTGGITARGDTVVIAVIDDGFQLSHEDLAESIWHNPGEIKGDEIDNDQNGFIDDYFGLNVFSGNDKHPVLSHGTSVSGIIGAAGNNNLGVAGVNWTVKIMPVSYNHYISELIVAYQYIINMRKRYTETKGKEGAFVVAVNLSSGLDFAYPENFPLWCSMYDSLGAYGILGVCSAPNFSHNVDEDGDLPSRCISPFTIIVTNVDPNDKIVSNAGYGRISVDLGAPGEQSLTTDTNSVYNYFRGTSAATPHVAGTIALMYTLLCPAILDSMEENPTNVALRLKNILLSTAAPNKSLDGITLTGSRLQADATLSAMIALCEEKIEDQVKIRFVAPNPSSTSEIRIYFEILQDELQDVHFELYSLDGRKIYNTVISQVELAQGYLVIPNIDLPGNIYLAVLRLNNTVTTEKLFVY